MNYLKELQGIEYKNTGNRARGRLSSYHRKPSPLSLNETEYIKDVQGLKPRHFSKTGSIYKANYTIGFEFEKTSLHRDAIKEYPLFTGFETDASCGYEVVTHILPLLPASQWRTKIFSLFYDAEHIIDDNYSPSDLSCGGHITIRVEGLTSQELAEKLRRNLGIVYALFRKRLRNSYCGHNLNLIGSNYAERFGAPCHSGYTSAGARGYERYSALLPKANGCLEFRLVSRFTSVKQTTLRYKLIAELVDFSISKPNGTHASFLKKIKPLIAEMYENDEAKVNEILNYAKDFRRYLVSKGRTIPNSIAEFVDYHQGNRELNRSFQGWS